MVDTFDKPVMVVSRQNTNKHSLYKRVVFIALKDFKGRVYIQKRAKHCALPDYWDLSAAGHVHAGESREDAARRELLEEINIHGTKLIRVAQRRPTEFAASFGTLYLAGPTTEIPIPNAEEVSDGMFVDRQELEALMDFDPEHITPALKWAYDSGFLFKN